MRKLGMTILMLLAGCAAHQRMRPLRPLQIPIGPYHELTTAALTGTLMYEGNCLLFRDDSDGSILMPVWPIGSTFNGTALIFHEPGKAEQRIMVTEQFQMSGQPLQWSALATVPYQLFQQKCGAAPFFVSKVRPAN